MKNKRFLSLVLSIVLVASLFTGFVSTASAENDVLSYSVRNGDYLFKICKAHGLDYYQCKNAIMILNGFTSEIQLNRLTVGQVVKLPASNAIAQTVKGSQSTTTTVTTSTTVNGVTTTTSSTSTVNGVASNYKVSFYLIPHVVQSGETLATICTAYGTTYAQYASMILAMNNISSPNNVWAGKTIYIPSTKTPSAGGFYAVVAHTVQSGDTMTKICSNYGTSYSANASLINGLNGKKSLNTIYVGQTLYIPVVASVNPGGGSGSSGGVSPASKPVESGYIIKFNDPDDGEPYAAVDGYEVTRAEAGKTVSVIGNPNEGYAVKSIKVTRLDTNANVLVNGNTFTMPESNVKVTVTYSTAWRLTKASTTNGKFTMSVNGIQVAYANYGDEVVITPNANDDYAVQYDDGTKKYQVYYTYDGGSKTGWATRNEDGTFSMNMPNSDVTVYVKFASAKYFKINNNRVEEKNSTVENAAGAVAITYKVGNDTITKAAKSATVKATLEVKKGWKVVKVEVTDLSDVLLDKCNLKKSDDNNYSFTMPAGEVRLKVTLRRTTTYHVSASAVGDGKGSFTVYVTDQYTGEKVKTSEAKEGDTVTVYPNPDSKCKYDDKAEVRYASGNAKVTASVVTNFIEFVMPDAAVKVTAQFSKAGSNVRLKINSSTSEHGKIKVFITDSTSVTPPDNTYFEGDKSLASHPVRIYVYPSSGYVVSASESYYTDDTGTKIYFTDSKVKYDSTDNYYQFTMNSTKDTKVYVKFVASGHFATLTKQTPYYIDDGGNTVAVGGMDKNSINCVVDNVSIVDGGQIRSGAKLYIITPEKTGYTLKDVEVDVDGTLNKYTDTNSKIAKSSDNKYSFIVPEGVTDVKVCARYSAVEYAVQYSQPDTTKGTYTISVNGGAPVTSDTKASNGQKVELTITPVEGYAISQLAINKIKVDEDDIKGSGPYNYTFTMPAENVVTEVVFAVDPDYVPPKAKYAVTAGANIIGTPSEKVEEGSTVEYQIDYGSYDENLSEVTVKINGQKIEGNPGSFIMPAADTVVEAEIAKKKFAIGTSWGNHYDDIDTSGYSVKEEYGKTLTIILTPESGYSIPAAPLIIKDLDTWTDITSICNVSLSGNVVTFVMPTYNINIIIKDAE